MEVEQPLLDSRDNKKINRDMVTAMVLANLVANPTNSNSKEKSAKATTGIPGGGHSPPTDGAVKELLQGGPQSSRSYHFVPPSLSSRSSSEDQMEQTDLLANKEGNSFSAHQQSQDEVQKTAMKQRKSTKKKKTQKSRKGKETGSLDDGSADDDSAEDHDGGSGGGHLPMSRRERKNNREKQRRMEVNTMFEKLMDLLGMPKDSKSDKVRVLAGAIDTIELLRNELSVLQRCTSLITGSKPNDLASAISALSSNPALSAKLAALGGFSQQNSQQQQHAAAAAALGGQFTNLLSEQQMQHLTEQQLQQLHAQASNSGPSTVPHSSLYGNQSMSFTGNYGMRLPQLQQQSQSAQVANQSSGVSLQQQYSRQNMSREAAAAAAALQEQMAAGEFSRLAASAKASHKRKTDIASRGSDKRNKATDTASTIA